VVTTCSRTRVLARSGWETNNPIIDAVPTWVAPFAGQATVSCDVFGLPGDGGNGLTVTLYDEATSVAQVSIGPTDHTHHTLSATRTVVTGQRIFLRINNNADNEYDYFGYALGSE